MVPSFRRILHIWSWFRNGEDKGEYCCRGMWDEVKATIAIKTKVKKTMNRTVKYSEVIEIKARTKERSSSTALLSQKKYTITTKQNTSIF